MDLEFEQKGISCIKPVLRQLLQQEQTQELRLSDGMHDAGRILGCWGQVILRGKEWRRDSVSCNGGVMVWILYGPEDGTNPETVETWIPFQMKYDLGESWDEGVIRVQSLLRSVDARIVSARKILVRCSIGTLAEAWGEDSVKVSVPGKMPEDVQLLVNRYPLRIPKLAGEKTFQMEEDFHIPASMPQPEKIIAYAMEPQVTESRLVAGKLVFHGVGRLHMVYQSGDGQVSFWDQEFPFSQFAELTGQPSADAQSELCMAVTALELSLEAEGRLTMKCGALAQFLVDDRELLELVQDAYSTERSMEIQQTELKVPAILEQRLLLVAQHQSLRQKAESIADITFLPDFPQCRKYDQIQMELPGKFQVLYYDENGNLQGAAAQAEESKSFPIGENCTMDAMILPSAPASASAGNGIEMKAENQLNLRTMTGTGMNMITGLRIGDALQTASSRPSLILRRTGHSSLWDMAKQTRSTVDRIRMANALDSEPGEEQILLIPVS